MTRKIGILLGAWLVLECATPYQHAGLSGGYEDQKIDTGHHYISFSGNRYTSREKAKDYWHRRAAELCPEGYEVLNFTSPDWFTIMRRKKKSEVADYVDANRPFVEGHIKCTIPEPSPQPANR